MKRKVATLIKPYILCLLFIGLGFVVCVSQDVKLDIEVDKQQLAPGETDVCISFVMTNTTVETYSVEAIQSGLYDWKTKELVFDIETDKLLIDPNGNGFLDPGETWEKEISKDINVGPSNSLVIKGGAHLASIDCESVLVGDAELLLAYGVNMDVNILNEIISPGDIINITLTSRLLINEEVAKDPGTVLVELSDGTTVEIPLPITQWEARDLILTVTGINDNLPFDPFNQDEDFGLVNFCEQGGADSGRNSENVLDECEPIETVREPCVMQGENDVNCEFPDWVFCYDIQTPSDDESFLQFTIDYPLFEASDSFSIWKADENPTGSGMFDEFVDVSNIIVSTGNDVAIPPYNIAVSTDDEFDYEQFFSVFPNPAASYFQVISKDRSEDYFFNVYDQEGILILENMPLSKRDANTSALANGAFLIKIYSSDGNVVNSQKLIVIK